MGEYCAEDYVNSINLAVMLAVCLFTGCFPIFQLTTWKGNQFYARAWHRIGLLRMRKWVALHYQAVWRLPAGATERSKLLRHCKSRLWSVKVEEYIFFFLRYFLSLRHNELTRKTYQVSQGGKLAGSPQVARTRRTDHEGQGRHACVSIPSIYLCYVTPMRH